jgi:hypothetical protein
MMADNGLFTLRDSSGNAITGKTISLYNYDGSNPPNYRGTKIADYTEADATNHPGGYNFSVSDTQRVVAVYEGNNIPGWVGRWLLGDVIVGESW